MRSIAAVIFGWLLCGTALACSCVHHQLDTETARKASHVFVFRVVSTQVGDATDEDPFGDYRISARIRVLAHVRGKTSARELDYSIHWCCGIRLETGKDYLGFLPADRQLFQANLSNVLPLWDRFTREQADQLEAVLRGKKSLEEAFLYGMQEIPQVRPPPAPCPARQQALAQP
jgi:hypothetical protein